MGGIGVLMVGAGEYTCGFVQTEFGAASDKPAGVVALTCFDLRRQGKVGRMVLCDRSGTRMPAVRQTLQTKIAEAYKGLDVSLECFPGDTVEDDPAAYLQALATMSPGDVAIIFTPDDSHFDIALACIRHGLHVLVAKPLVKKLKQHLELIQEARAHKVLVAVEYHKRFDPMYHDAHDRIRTLGLFSYYYSYMAQPKQQLDTFRSWAGRSSDINFYLNSHHIDIHNWLVGHMAIPLRVVATASTGVADKKLARPCEDTITLTTQWQNKEDGSLGTAVYTASWVAPVKGECHTRQHFFYVGHKGELAVNQAHRGYVSVTDEGGYASLNPLYMRYLPDVGGRFTGQNGYGYISIAKFVDTARELTSGMLRLAEVKEDSGLAVIESTVAVTAILEAGRISLDHGGLPVEIQYDERGVACGLKVA